LFQKCEFLPVQTVLWGVHIFLYGLLQIPVKTSTPHSGLA
jgi:hypothetical protein